MGILKQLFGAKRNTNHRAGNTARKRELVSNGYDLMKMSEHYPTCAECSKYQGRVYSISGKDNRFPPLSVVPNGGIIHDGCKHTLAPYMAELQTAAELRRDIAFSKRPFVDTRPQVERALYERQQEQDRQMLRDVDNYRRLQAEIPDLAPKSYAGFKRMKNARTPNYLKLVEAARIVGIEL